tara:strand:+ start:12175 stop:12522 length:348 start_codon:yes stop_codon:yes gene_type:complete
MAEAFGHLMAPEGYEIMSAGSNPSGQINPLAITTMQEIGYDLSSHISNNTKDLKGKVDVLVSMGCGDSCPHLDCKERIEWNIPDPKNLSLKEFRKVRDKIKEEVKILISKLEEPS